MNLDDFSTVVDDRRYINPQVSLDEQNAFINNLRSTQQARNEEIATDTYNLGTAVPSNLGGLGGSGSYFNARYQTPQTNAVVADLRAAAQAQALNDVMNNELAQAQQRYNNAYKAYQKRANSNPTTTGPDGDAGGAKLPITTNGGNSDPEKIPSNGSDTIRGNTHVGSSGSDSIYRYRKNGAEWEYDGAAPLSSTSPLASPLSVGKDGTLKTIGGKQYIAINGHWYPVTKTPLWSSED